MTTSRFTMRHKLIVIVILVVMNAVIWTGLLSSKSDDSVGRGGEVIHAFSQ